MPGERRTATGHGILPRLMTRFECRFCGAPLNEVVADLGSSPLSNAYLSAERLQQAEATFPLCAYLCEQCLLVQLPEFEAPEAIFSDYAYFSSYSDTWLAHARRYVEMMAQRFALDERHLVVEVASNDGYLLRFFKQRGVPVLGIEPAANVARAAEELGIETRVEFFGTESARELAAAGRRADLLLGNNVLAHTPRLNDFVAGLGIALAERGIVTMEFPHLVRLIAENQFDTIYHEHFSYFSFLAVRRIFAAHGLEIFDVEELPTHGGSLRIFARHADDDSRPVTRRVAELTAREKELGLEGVDYYRAFGEQVRETKRKLLLHARQIRRLQQHVRQEGRTVIPLELYFNDKGRVKLELALAAGKRRHDKRQAMAEKQSKRDMERALKHR